MRRSQAVLIVAVLILVVATLIGLLFRRPKSPPALPLWERSRTVRLFFALEKGLAEEERLIIKQSTVAEEAKQAVDELIKGPSERLFPTIPQGTRLLNLFVDRQGIAYVNFDAQLRENHAGGSFGELLTVYSIVDTLAANFPQIKKVQILLEGNEVPTLVGHLDLQKPLSPKFSFEPKT